MARYQSTFDIQAPADRVWQILTAFERYGEWNPQIRRASGIPEEGERIMLRLALPGRPAMDLVATIEQATVSHCLSWRGHVLAPWFFEGRREFVIHERDRDHVSVTHLEDVHGAFAPLFLLIMGGAITRSQRALNDALRRRAETHA